MDKVLKYFAGIMAMCFIFVGWDYENAFIGTIFFVGGVIVFMNLLKR